MNRRILVLLFSFSVSFLYSQNALLLFAGQGSSKSHNTFLGCLNCPSTDPSSIFNVNGQYGSAFGLNSIWNKSSQYGSEFGLHSPFNINSTSPPVIVDKSGGFYGYLTINQYYNKRSKLQIAEEILQIGWGSNGYQRNNFRSDKYIRDEFPEPALFQPNWNLIDDMLKRATKQVEELYRNGYVFDEVKKQFVKKEEYSKRVTSKQSQIQALIDEYNLGGFAYKNDLDDGVYDIGLYTPKFQTDEVLYGKAKIKNNILIHVDVFSVSGTQRLYPEYKNAKIYRGTFEGVLLLTKYFKLFANQQFTAILYIINK